MMQLSAHVPPKPPVSPAAVQAAPRTGIAVIAVMVSVLALAVVAGLLWFQYGAAVFFDIVAAGIAACF